MRLVLTLNGVETEFVESGADGAYPWLTSLGDLLLEARAGHLASIGRPREAANMTFEVDDADRQAATLLGFAVRAQAIAYDDAGDELLSGLVQSIEYGPKRLSGTIEA